MPKYTLSKSSLSLLEECPKCFWLYVVKKVRRPAGIFPSLPSGMDSILKNHFDNFRKRGELPPELVKEDVKAKLFDNIELLNVWRNNRKGIMYTDPNSDVTLMGAVDDILQDGNKLIVLDYKTRGFALKEDTAHMYQDQINIYNFLLRKNGHETEDYGYLLFFMPKEVNKDGSFAFYSKLVKMDVNVNHAEDLFNKAIRVLMGDEPKSSQNCGFCAWKKM